MSGIVLATRDVLVHDVLNAEISGEMLEVRWALDGQEAYDMCMEDTPDMVIADIVLDVYGAYELCSMLRTDPTIPKDMPIILLVEGGVNTKKVMKGGFTAVFQKPHVIISLREMMYTELKPEALPKRISD